MLVSQVSWQPDDAWFESLLASSPGIDLDMYEEVLRKSGTPTELVDGVRRARANLAAGFVDSRVTRLRDLPELQGGVFERQFLVAGSKPPVRLVALPSNERRSLPLGLKLNQPFDIGLLREGWVGVQVGAQNVALHDGDLENPVRLPDGNGFLIPSRDPSLLLLSPPVPHAARVGRRWIAALDRDGQVVRECELPTDELPLGELASGAIVTEACELFTWDGRSIPFPVEPDTAETVELDGQRVPAISLQVVGVIGGRLVVCTRIDRRGEIRVSTVIHDAETSRSVELAAPVGVRWVHSPPHYDAGANRMACAGSTSHILVVTLDHGARWIESGLRDVSSLFWIDERRVLAIASFENEHVVLDIESGAMIGRLAGWPARSWWPRVDVTGRFELPAQPLAATTRTQRMTPARRARLLREDEARIRAAAAEAGVTSNPLEGALTAVRIGTHEIMGEIPLGRSRLGGRPDVPDGFAWPQEKGGEPLVFLVQLRLDELRAADPETRCAGSGLLSVFVPQWFVGSAHAEVVPTKKLIRLDWPDSLGEEHRLSPALVSLEPMLALADWPAFRAKDSDAAIESFRALLDRGPDHRVFGRPSTIQGQGLSAGRESLLQIDSDSAVDVMFGDGGRLLIDVPKGTTLCGLIGGCEVTPDSY